MKSKSRAIGIILAMILGALIGLASPASARNDSTTDKVDEPTSVSYTSRKGVEVTGTQVSGPTADAPASTTGDSGSIEITSESYSNVSQSLSWSNVIDILINGAHQLVWWYPNHNIKITNEAITNAPYIKVTYKPCPKQSQSIAKQAHGAPIVVAKVGSVICNTGKKGNIVGGFKWTVVKPAILKWNKQLKLYEHIFTLSKPGALEPDDEVVGHIKFHGVKYAIVKKCKNRMGGHVDRMFDSVVQVRYQRDVQQSGSLAGETSADANVGMMVACSNGSTFSVNASASASASFTETFEFTESTKLNVEGAHRVHLYEESLLKMKANARSGAKASIKIDFFCSTPVTDKAPSVNIGSEVCTAPGGTQGELTAASTNNDSVTRTLVFHLSGGPTSKPDVTKTVAAGDTVQVPFKGLAKGMYTVKVTVEETGLSASDSASIIDCAPPVYTAPSVSASAQACVAPGGTTGVDIAGLNPNDVAAPGAFTLGSRSKDLGTVAANGTPSWTFNNVGIGTYTVGFALGAPINKTATTTVNVIECVYPAPTITLTNVNDYYVNASGDICATADFPAGHAGTITWNAEVGTFAKSSTPATDGVQVCVKYTAPGEGPSQGTDTDTVTVKATDGVTDKFGTASDTFNIKDLPAPPAKFKQ